MLTQGCEVEGERAAPGPGPEKVAFARLFGEHGYTMKDIADLLDPHYTTIGVILRQAEGRTLRFKTCPTCDAAAETAALQGLPGDCDG